MVETDTNFHTGHRDRLRQKFLDGKLADYELLELLLGYAIPRRDVRPLARALVKKYGRVADVLNASIEDMVTVPGIGHNTAVFIKAIRQATLLNFQSKLDTRPVFYDFAVLANYCRLLLCGKTEEEFHVLYLGKDFRLIKDEMHSHGTVNWTSVYPREIVKHALDLNAISIVMIHNHPLSGNVFSQDDIEITEKLITMLRPFDISVYDHLLVANNNVYSARNMFLIHDEM